MSGPTEVAILLLPGAFTLDVSIPEHVFGRRDDYAVHLCGPGDGSAYATATRPLADVGRADLVVVPGYEHPGRPLPAEYLAALRGAADAGARFLAVCTGVFALAEAGLLAGRRVTTHDEYAGALRAAHPDLEVVDRVLVEDGPFLTTAGASAGFDACLHVVHGDRGPTEADGLARHLVVDRTRRPAAPVDGRPDLDATRRWAVEHLGAPLTVDRLAGHARMSRRTFIRRFEAETGTSPMRWVTAQRILAVRRLLEETDLSIERVAADTGFGTAANLRTIFRRETGTTPSGFRRDPSSTAGR